MITRYLVLFLFVLLLPKTVFADIIYLESGKTVEGKIIEETDEYIRIDFQGVPLTYYRDDIAKIKDSSDSLDLDQVKAEDQLHDFRIGLHQVRGNYVEFRFPEGMETLYLFSTQRSQEPRPDDAQLIVKLYDQNKNELTLAKSNCVAANRNSFGSLLFSEISRENVDRVGYFSLSVHDCGQETDLTEEPGQITEGEGELTQTYLRFLDTIERKDRQELEKYMLEEGIKELEEMVEGDIGQLFMVMSYMIPKNLRNVKEEVRGDQALLTATGSTEMLGQEIEVAILFVRKNGNWMIDEVRTKDQSHLRVE